MLTYCHHTWGSTDSRSNISVCTPALVMPCARVCGQAHKLTVLMVRLRELCDCWSSQRAPPGLNQVLPLVPSPPSAHL